MKRIDFEGVDGAGKTTLMAAFMQELRDLGATVLGMRAMGTPQVELCGVLRDMVVGGAHGGTSSHEVRQLLCLAMEKENERYREEVRYQYDVCVSDRGYYSRLVYGERDVPWVTRDMLSSLGVTPPHMVVFCDAAVDVVEARRGGRGTTDVVESRGNDYLYEIQRRFRDVLGASYAMPEARGAERESRRTAFEPGVEVCTISTGAPIGESLRAARLLAGEVWETLPASKEVRP